MAKKKKTKKKSKKSKKTKRKKSKKVSVARKKNRKVKKSKKTKKVKKKKIKNRKSKSGKSKKTRKINFKSPKLIEDNDGNSIIKVSDSWANHAYVNESKYKKNINSQSEKMINSGPKKEKELLG